MRRLILALWLAPLYAQESQPTLFSEISEILDQLSSITGWKASRTVASDTISKAGLKDFLEQRMKEVVKPEDIRAEEVTLKKFGLVPADFDLRKMTIDLLTEQAAAFYDYKKKKLFVLDTNATIAQKPVLVHELAHALADQQVNLEKYIFKGKSDDSGLARQSVMEGQATWLMSEYLMAKMGTSLTKSPEMVRMMNNQAASSGSAFPVFESAPLYLRESLMFPYTKGFLFQHEVIVKHGKDGFTEVFRNPPASSQQILHPEKYFARLQPLNVPLPKFKLRGYAGFVEGQIGEFDHDVLFRQYAKDSAADTSSHWRGANYRIYEHKKSRRTVLVYASEWDSPDSAAAAFRLYRAVLKGKWKSLSITRETPTLIEGAGDDGKFTLQLSNTRLTSTEGLPQ